MTDALADLVALCAARPVWAPDPERAFDADGPRVPVGSGTTATRVGADRTTADGQDVARAASRDDSAPTGVAADAPAPAAARDSALPAGPAAPPRPVRASAVLVLLGTLDDVPAGAARSAAPAVPADLDVLLTRRSPTLRHHPGQVSFPGGGIDATDAGPEAAALREAQEETGLDPAGVRVLGTLPPLPVTASRNLVTPVLGWWDRPSAVAATDPAETVDVFRVPVADLVDPANRVTATLTHRDREYRGPAFTVAGVVVWGFTAFVLDRLLDALGWAEPWDAGRTVPAPL